MLPDLDHPAQAHARQRLADQLDPGTVPHRRGVDHEHVLRNVLRDQRVPHGLLQAPPLLQPVAPPGHLLVAEDAAVPQRLDHEVLRRRPALDRPAEQLALGGGRLGLDRAEIGGEDRLRRRRGGGEGGGEPVGRRQVVRVEALDLAQHRGHHVLPGEDPLLFVGVVAEAPPALRRERGVLGVQLPVAAPEVSAGHRVQGGGLHAGDCARLSNGGIDTRAHWPQLVADGGTCSVSRNGGEGVSGCLQRCLAW
ncbi:hypothetical protein C8D87_11523 [Lentzea atacamensis]|uniref:Uncharacterized protein n=1 Tax=Lentzea atacamensis TaxID=531938 RepID=A0ABX9DYI7_9PSEU|nr:hypothetical protein [Lentzea atacamensis]RAS59164.1 hypothetical protein C8D87_11523 [Lentzea atacamensis]